MSFGLSLVKGSIITLSFIIAVFVVDAFFYKKFIKEQEGIIRLFFLLIFTILILIIWFILLFIVGTILSPAPAWQG